MELYTPITSYSEEDINSSYNDVDETLGKPNHYTIVMGDCSVQIWKRRNPVESRVEMDMEYPKRCYKDRIDYILSNWPDIVTYIIVTNQVHIGCDHRLVMDSIKVDVEVERQTLITKSRCHTNRIKEDRIPTRTEQPIKDSTITKRLRHHLRHDPTQRVKNC